MINPITLCDAVRRKKHMQVVLADNNPTGFKLIPLHKAKDRHVLSDDFIGTFTNKTSYYVFIEVLTANGAINS